MTHDSKQDGSEPLDPETVELLEEFVAESREVLQEVEPELVALENPGNDPGEVADSVSAVFRLFHSMKGSAGFLGLNAVAEVTHVAESLLARIRDAHVVPDPGDVDALCLGLDTVNKLLGGVEEHYRDDGFDELVATTVARLAEALNQFEARTRGESEITKSDVAELELEPPPATESATADADSSSEPTPRSARSPEMRRVFEAESAEQLDELESFLVEADKEPPSPESVDAAFRAIHSLKGNAGFMGLTDIETLAHSMEDVLQAVRDGQLSLRARIVSSLLAGLDSLRSGVAEDGAIADVERLAGNCRSFLEDPSARGRARGRPLGELLVEQGTLTPEQLEEALSWQSKKLGEIVVDLGVAKPDQIENALSDQQRDETPSKSAASTKPVPAKSASTSYIRVDLVKLDALLNQVGELITAAATVVQSPVLRESGAETLQQSVSHLSRITSGLHDTAMAMRMVPLGATFRKVLRVVRDVSKKLGKKVNVELRGEETEVDKTVIEAIADPLVHIVRNAVDHGVEHPDVRSSRGKPPAGTVELSARHQGGEVWITVRDDGGGIDPARLLERAKERGIVDPSVDFLPDHEAYALLFAPGFSTAAAVTDISGRGVGMDVVKRNLEAVRGRIEVESTVGEGSSFIIRIPLTLAIIDAMLVRVAHTLYAVPLLSIRESVRIQSGQVVVLPGGSEMARVRGSVFPIVRLHELHRVDGAETDVSEGILIMVEDGGDSLCLFADEIVGQRQIVIKALDPYIAGIRGISGCSVTGTGEICLIVDVNAVVRDSRRQSSNPSVDASEMRESA